MEELLEHNGIKVGDTKEVYMYGDKCLSTVVSIIKQPSGEVVINESIKKI